VFNYLPVANLYINAIKVAGAEPNPLAQGCSVYIHRMGVVPFDKMITCLDIRVSNAQKAFLIFKSLLATWKSYRMFSHIAF
jgi:hypothetical protein